LLKCGKLEEIMKTKKFQQMTTEEKMNANIFFKIGYLISKEVGECENYSVLDRYYRYQNNVKSESTGNGRVYTSILWLSPEIASKHQMPEKIEIKTGAIKMQRDVFYKEKHTGNTMMTEPYEVVIGEGQNADALPKLLSGFFTAQSENRK
jgi:hypothetical protein